MPQVAGSGTPDTPAPGTNSKELLLPSENTAVLNGPRPRIST
jgi:hypothetical protein